MASRNFRDPLCDQVTDYTNNHSFKFLGIRGGPVSQDDFEPNVDRLAWFAVREFVTSAVNDCAGRTPYGARDLKVAAVRLAVWSWQTAGLPLERDIVFNRDVIARFIAIGCPNYKPAVRGNYRSQLLRMSEALLTSRVQRRLSPLPPSDPTAPYSEREIRSLRSWAAAQSTFARRANAEVLLAAGAGAGLSASELGDLRVADIQVDDYGVLLKITGERSREVPVLREWEAGLIDRVKTMAPERFAFRENHATFYPNLVTNFINRSRVVGVRPQSQRLRSTWIVHHLEIATPASILMKAAGVDSLEALNRYIRFAANVDDVTARRLLRGSG